VTVTKKGAGEGAEHQNAPFGCISTLISPVITPTSTAAGKVREGAGEGAEIVFRPASNIICITRSLASRFVEEIALV
jgi:hypothetical protein